MLYVTVLCVNSILLYHSWSLPVNPKTLIIDIQCPQVQINKSSLCTSQNVPNDNLSSQFSIFPYCLFISFIILFLFFLPFSATESQCLTFTSNLTHKSTSPAEKMLWSFLVSQPFCLSFFITKDAFLHWTLNSHSAISCFYESNCSTVGTKYNT